MVGSENIYLEPEESFAEVQALAVDQGQSFPISPRTLHSRLHDRGLLASTDTAREVLTVRRTLEGQRRSVLHLHTHLLYHRPDQPDQLAQNAEKTSIPCGRVEDNNRPHPTTNPTANPTTPAAKPDHVSDPTTNPTTVTPCAPNGTGAVVGLVGSETHIQGTAENNPSSTDREVFEV